MAGFCQEQNPAMPPRYTVHPVQIRSLASMPPRYTVHPVHKKTGSRPVFNVYNFNTYYTALVEQLSFILTRF